MLNFINDTVNQNYRVSPTWLVLSILICYFYTESRGPVPGSNTVLLNAMLK